MKKTLLFALCFLIIIISGCRNSVATESDTTKKQTSYAESYNDKNNTQTSKNENNALISTETQSETSCIETSMVFSERYDDSPTADILQFDLETLKALKKAAETMSDAEFERYLEEKRLELAWFEMVNTTEKFNSLLDDIENIYVAVLDENTQNIQLTYYINEKRVFQSVSFSEMRRFAFDFYVDNESFCYATMEGAEYTETVNINSVKADIYTFENKAGFCADAVLGEQKFNIRVSEAQTIEEFEEDFARLTFVKTGDLLNE